MGGKVGVTLGLLGRGPWFQVSFPSGQSLSAGLLASPQQRNPNSAVFGRIAQARLWVVICCSGCLFCRPPSTPPPLPSADPTAPIPGQWALHDAPAGPLPLCLALKVSWKRVPLLQPCACVAVCCQPGNRGDWTDSSLFSAPRIVVVIVGFSFSGRSQPLPSESAAAPHSQSDAGQPHPRG